MTPCLCAPCALVDSCLCGFAPPRPLRESAALHAEILARLGPSPLAEDQLIRDLASPAQAVTPALVALELDGRITRHPGGLVSLAV